MNSAFSFREIREKFNALSQREQLLVVVVVGAALYFLLDALVFMPQSKRELELIANQKTAQAKLTAIEADIAAVQRTTAEMIAKQKVDYSRMKKQMAMLNAISSSMTQDSPRIADLVKGVVKTQYPTVSLENLKTLPVKSLLNVNKGNSANAAASAAPSQPVIYKYGVEFELRGSYVDLMSYLKSLEQSGNTLFWSAAVLSAPRYPEASMRVTVFMLSAQPNQGVSS